MPIIIEGPDGAGKSTLAKALADKLDMNILKMTCNCGQSATEYMQKLACGGVVIDRCWISEQIYADIFGRTQRIDDDACEKLTHMCSVLGIPIVIVLPPLAEVVRRLTLRGDEFGDVVTDNIGLIYRRYEEFAAANSSVITLDDDDVDRCIKEVLKCML